MNAARVAIRNQTGFFNQQRGRVVSEWKPDETRVPFADFAISEKVCEELRRSFPEDQFLSEESGLLDEVVPVESRYAWVLDPIDGTNNYALGMSACAISLALLKQGKPVYGLIYDGSTGELCNGYWQLNMALWLGLRAVFASTALLYLAAAMLALFGLPQKSKD